MNPFITFALPYHLLAPSAFLSLTPFSFGCKLSSHHGKVASFLREVVSKIHPSLLRRFLRSEGSRLSRTAVSSSCSIFVGRCAISWRSCAVFSLKMCGFLAQDVRFFWSKRSLICYTLQQMPTCRGGRPFERANAANLSSHLID